VKPNHFRYLRCNRNKHERAYFYSKPCRILYQ